MDLELTRAQIILAQGPDRQFAPYDRFAQFHESQGRALAERNIKGFRMPSLASPVRSHVLRNPV
jgi:hypothetical protein